LKDLNCGLKGLRPLVDIMGPLPEWSRQFCPPVVFYVATKLSQGLVAAAVAPWALGFTI